MTTDKARKTAANAVGKLLAEEVGGCFNSEDDTHGECADGDCYCSKRARSIADVSIDAYLSSSTEDGGEAEIRDHYAGTNLALQQTIGLGAEEWRERYLGAFEHVTTLLSTTAALRARINDLDDQIASYEQWASDVNNLTRQLDVELNGENAARQASLCDLVGSIAPLRQDLEQMRKALEEIGADDAGWAAYGYTDPGMALDRCIRAARRALTKIQSHTDEFRCSNTNRGLNFCEAKVHSKSGGGFFHTCGVSNCPLMAVAAGQSHTGEG